MPLPEHLAKARHWDWPWPFSLVPRRWTTFDWGIPKQAAGSQLTCKTDRTIMLSVPSPIGEENSWQFSYYPGAPWWAKPIAWYFAWSGERKEDGKFKHFRAGARYDDVDSYVTWPSVAIRRYTGEDIEDTSTN